MAEINITLALRQPHAEVFSCKKRFVVLVAGRRWGKTVLALWWLIVNAFSNTDRICYYVAPTYGQAKRIAWSILKKLVPPEARRRTSEQELLIELRNGSTIQLHGADRPDRLRGVGLDFVVMDEFAGMRAETWDTVIRPALSDRRGRALFIGTPKGFDHFYALYCGANYGNIGVRSIIRPRIKAMFQMMNWPPSNSTWIHGCIGRNSVLLSRIYKVASTMVLTARRTS